MHRGTAGRGRTTNRTRGGDVNEDPADVVKKAIEDYAKNPSRDAALAALDTLEGTSKQWYELWQKASLSVLELQAQLTREQDRASKEWELRLKLQAHLVEARL